MVRRLLPVTLLVVALAACGESTGRGAVDPGPAERPTEVPAAAGQVTTSQPVVVSDEGAGAMLCFGSIMFGAPPECSDADVAGWSWTDHEGDYEDSDGVRWGSFLLTGAFDGTTFTPSEVRPATAYQPQELESFDIPCPEPDGGWRVVDPARVTDERYSELSNVAEGLPGFALIAVSGVDGSPGQTDPFETVVTVYVAGDPTKLRRSFDERGEACCAWRRSTTPTPN